MDPHFYIQLKEWYRLASKSDRTDAEFEKATTFKFHPMPAGKPKGEPYENRQGYQGNHNDLDHYKKKPASTRVTRSRTMADTVVVMIPQVHPDRPAKADTILSSARALVPLVAETSPETAATLQLEGRLVVLSAPAVETVHLPLAKIIRINSTNTTTN